MQAVSWCHSTYELLLTAHRMHLENLWHILTLLDCLLNLLDSMKCHVSTCGMDYVISLCWQHTKWHPSTVTAGPPYFHNRCDLVCLKDLWLGSLVTSPMEWPRMNAGGRPESSMCSLMNAALCLIWS